MRIDGRTYRRGSDRLASWDYGSAGAYYVTICTRSHHPRFGKILDGEMYYNDAGLIAREELLRTPVIRKNIRLDDWVIMPNHLHLILIILADPDKTPRRGVSTDELRRWRSGSLGAIINQYKSICTKRIRRSSQPQFAWQSGYYDHVIRNEVDQQRIRAYLRSNPARWAFDRYYHPE